MLKGTVKCAACGWYDADVVLAHYLDEVCPSCLCPLMDEREKRALRILIDLNVCGILRQDNDGRPIRSVDLLEVLP